MNSTEKWDNWLNIRLNKRQIVPSNQKPAQPILFIIHDIYLSGSQLFLVRFLEWIKQNQPLPLEITIGISRNEIGVYGDGGKFILDRLEKCGVVHFVNPHTKLPENVDAIRAGNYSLIYVNTCTLGGLLNSIGQIPTPVIVHVHELSFWIEYKLGIEKFNLLLQYNPHWIACSNAVKNNLLNFCHVPSQKIEVIHEFIPFVDNLNQQPSLRQKIRKELKLAENTFVLASCGTIDWRKGGDLLIPLVVLLQKKLPHHNFVCIWIGSLTTEVENEMRYVIEQAGIQQNIMLLGSKTNALDYMSAADAFLLLSREDPFPLVMLEASACRLPVIAFDGSGGASEFVESDAGMLAPYLDLDAMAHNVVRLFENTELRKSMGDRAYAKVKNLYNENVLAPKIVDLIKRCQQHEVMPVHQPVHQVKVSVIVPNYNHASYLRQRLDSIYQQTYSNFEVILLDDASSDGSQEILNSYAKMPNTVLVENNSNSGSVFHQWQKGVSLAQGEYIWIAESDDFAAPTFLESLVQIMDKNPNVGLAYAQSNLVDGQGGILGKATGWTADLDSERWSQPFINHGQDEIGKFLIQKNTIPNASAVLLRKTVLLKCGLVDTSFRLCGDWLQWIKVLSQSDIAFVPECLNFWRQNTSNARVASAGTLEWIEGEKVLNYACEILNYSEAEKHNIMLKFLRRCWQWQKEFIEQTAGYSIVAETIKNQGYCYTCDRQVEFASQNTWLRDWYKCSNCGSIPRERSLMYCIEKFYPQWRNLSIHESSPGNRGASIKLKSNCPNYQASQYFTGFPLGKTHSSGWRNEDLENQTFADESFDLVITQDVMEHIFNPEKAFSEIARTLKPGGAHIFTVPIVNKEKPSRVRATLKANGEINYLEAAQYHGNPVSPEGSLVTRDWGYDICDFILKHSGLYTTLVYIDDLSLGIRAEYIEILISRKM